MDTISHWFYTLQDIICDGLLTLEKEYDPSFKGSFKKTTWKRPTETNEDGGGGTMAVLHGTIFEKGGVNVSRVHGCFNEIMQKEIPGALENPYFCASGLSLVIHPKNPYVPIVHMNTRRIETEKAWFGGGIDLTPTFPFEEDTHYFHNTLKKTCDRFNESYYHDFKKHCDTYFYIKHRKEPRGVGGIFYDYLNTGNIDDDFAFTKAVGEAFLKAYAPIVQKHMHTPYGEEELYAQSLKRSRYVEFNLVYDRGTRFGLLTEGHTEAILMSMPPLARWP
jgi:coproporphyrinogen III oxidase